LFGNENGKKWELMAWEEGGMGM